MFEATQKAVSPAKDEGVGIVTVKNSNHFGTASYYGEYIANQGCVGITMSNGECDVIPYGGKKKFIGTDPLCCCIPSHTKPLFCMDMATSEVAYGKVRAAAEAGEVIPANWAVDRKGIRLQIRARLTRCCSHERDQGICLGNDDRSPVQSIHRNALWSPNHMKI